MKQLEQTEWEALATVSAELMVILEDGKPIWLNEAWTRALGWSRQELLDGRWDALLGATWRDQSDVPPRSPLTTRAADELEVTWRAERRGAQLIVCGQIEDRRAREEAAEIITGLQAGLELARGELLKTTRMRSAFLASMSHELRTPLNAIIGYSELILEDAESGDADVPEHDIQKILSSANHLLSLINDILDLSRIESDRIELQHERVDLTHLLRSALDAVRPAVERAGNQVVLDVKDAPAVIWSDRARVYQIISNLLSNAAKFTVQGKVGLRAWLNTEDPKRPTVSICVSDTGVGIPQEYQGQLFEAFTQADTSATRAYGGAGLGLALARSFCVMMGGSITVESAPGEGSSFTVTLPVGEPVEVAGQPIAPTSSRLDEALCAPKTHLLIIDDDHRVHAMVRQLLLDDDVVVHSATNGLDGLRLAREIRPDVITLDVLMPGLNGWAVLASLKSDPKLAEIPVVMLTMVGDRAQGFALGASDYLTKPFDRRRLRDILGRFRRDQGGHILIVDDEPAAREMLRRRLEPDGWLISEAADGEAALVSMREHTPDLVILDLLMPTLDGFGVLDEMRRDPALVDLPVIIMTAMDLTAGDMAHLRGRVRHVVQKDGQATGHVMAELRALIQSQKTRAEEQS
jgi:signal transduction histidine kinase/CheY-like chemotaxis protein